MLPSISSMAAWAAPPSAKVTNPNPRDRPVSRSVMTLASTTSPKRPKASRSPSSLVSQLRPPTKSLLPIFSSSSHRPNHRDGGLNLCCRMLGLGAWARSSIRSVNPLIEIPGGGKVPAPQVRPRSVKLQHYTEPGGETREIAADPPHLTAAPTRARDQARVPVFCVTTTELRGVCVRAVGVPAGGHGAHAVAERSFVSL